MTVLFDEDGWETVRAIINGAEPVFVPFVVLTEVEYRLLQLRAERAEQDILTLEAWPVEIVESNRDWRRTAARLKAHHSISFADAWVAGLALLNDADLVHKDPEFDAVTELKHLRLPYKASNRGEPVR